MPVYRGPKKAKRHSTLIHEAVDVVNLLQRLEEVKRILPGLIRPGGSKSTVVLKVVDEPACLKVTVVGGSAVQELRIYTASHAMVRAELEKAFVVR